MGKEVAGEMIVEARALRELSLVLLGVSLVAGESGRDRIGAAEITEIMKNCKPLCSNDIGALIESIRGKKGKPIRTWLAARRVEIPEGEDVIGAVLSYLRKTAEQKNHSRALVELNTCIKSGGSDEDIAEVMQRWATVLSKSSVSKSSTK